jgi:hypothetical protein
VNDIGIFCYTFQRKTSEGKKKRTKYLSLCPPKELPPTPEHGPKWHANLQDLPLDWESKSIRMQKDDNFHMVQKELSVLVRKLVLERFWGSIEAIAGGDHIWQSQPAVTLRRYVEAKILPFLASSTHRVEAMV